MEKRFHFGLPFGEEGGTGSGRTDGVSLSS